MGQRHALHAHRRPLGRGGRLPYGRDPAARPNPAQAPEAGIELAQKIASCGPLGIRTTLESAHLSIDDSDAAAFVKLNEQFGGLFSSEGLIEGHKAEAEGRPPSTRASRPVAVPEIMAIGRTIDIRLRCTPHHAPKRQQSDIAVPRSCNVPD
jgi:hypothetical protein